jgi:hypothetical protein
MRVVVVERRGCSTSLALSSSALVTVTPAACIVCASREASLLIALIVNSAPITLVVPVLLLEVRERKQKRDHWLVFEISKKRIESTTISYSRCESCGKSQAVCDNPGGQNLGDQSGS